jgi:hypothetical protein
MKLVGDAFKDDRFYKNTEKNIVVLGVANWACVKNNHLLINRKSLKVNSFL